MNYNSYASHMKSRYGYRIFRVGVDAGFTCPNRLKSPSGAGCIYCDSQGARAAYLRSSESRFRHDSGFEETIDSMACLPSDCKDYSFIFDFQDIKKQVDRGLEFLARRYKASHFALYLQSFSNTFAPYEKLKELYDFATSLYPWESFIVSTRPDCLDRRKIDLLASYKSSCREVCVELGLQSGSDEILKAMNRGHDVKCFLDASKIVKNSGLKLCVHVLSGYPGEGEKELEQTVNAFNASGADYIKIHNLNIAKDTALYENYLCNKAFAPDVQSYIRSVSFVLRRISADVVVQRLLCETPSARLVCPKDFPDKNTFIKMLNTYMKENNYRQGDLFR